MKAFILLIAGLIFLPPVFISAIASDKVRAGEFNHCYDFGCKSMQSIDFSAPQWREIELIFTPPAHSPTQEKQQIRHAIALMESFAGAITGSSQDRAGNYNNVDLPFQQDCIDESTNTTQYLLALQRRGWLKWHQVAPRQQRIRWLFTHWTAVISQNNNGELFAVDSWYRDNGEPPYIQSLDDWRRKASFPESLNPD